MAELNGIRETVRDRYAAAAKAAAAPQPDSSACCDADALASCCEPAAKDECCHPVDGEAAASCGCTD